MCLSLLITIISHDNCVLDSYDSRINSIHHRAFQRLIFYISIYCLHSMQITIQLLGVVLEERTPEELQVHNIILFTCILVNV